MDEMQKWYALYQAAHALRNEAQEQKIEEQLLVVISTAAGVLREMLAEDDQG